MQPGTPSRPIVVVDDNPDDLFFFQRYLAKASVPNPLLIASDGEEAIAALHALAGPTVARTSKPLVVFIDLKLPRVTGFAVLEWIRRQRGLDAVPVAVLSSSEEERDVRRAYALGAQTYLVKPPILPELLAVIEAANLFAKAPLVDFGTLSLPGIPSPN